MCCGGSSGALSRLSITVGLLSLITLITAFITNAWLYTREPVHLPGSSQLTSVTFRIGFWRVCPALKRVATTPNTLLPAPGCQGLQYSSWKEVKEADLGIFWSSLEFTPTFVTKMKYAMPLVALATALVSLATLFALLGHCNSDLKTLIACGLYTLGGLTLASGLIVFVSVLSDVYTDRPRHSQLEYKYGWSFQAAGTAFILAEVAALVSISAYLRRFSTVEDMVRAVVPGADRKLRHHQLCAEYLGRRQRPAPEAGQESSLPTPPDICTTKPPLLLAESGRRSLSATLPLSHRHLKASQVPIRNRNVPIPQVPSTLPHPHPATLVLPEHEPYRYTTIIHQGLLGVAEGTSSSGSSSSSGGTCSSHSHSLPRGRRPPHPHTLDCRRSESPSSGSQGYCSAVT